MQDSGINLLLSEELKAATQRQHTLVESHPVMHCLMSGGLTVELYAQVLRTFYGFYAPLEQMINKVPGMTDFLPDLPQRMRAHLALKDLSQLGLPNAVPMAKPAQLPEVENAAHAMGCLYVLEGSTLGGQLICRHLQQTLPDHCKSATQFFGAHGAQTGQYWRIFKEVLNNFTDTYTEIQQAIAAANHTFGFLYSWMNEQNA